MDILITTYTVLGRWCQTLANKYPDLLGFLGVIKDPSWSEEVILTCMSYMAVLAAALAIRRGAHIRMTAFDRYLPKAALKALDILADAIVVLNCGIGLLTPPVGAVLFIGSAVAKRPMEKVVKATLSLYLCMIVALLLISFIPDISLAIPKLLGGYEPTVLCPPPSWQLTICCIQ